jgi:hypothetical protein
MVRGLRGKPRFFPALDTSRGAAEPGRGRILNTPAQELGDVSFVDTINRIYRMNG